MLSVFCENVSIYNMHSIMLQVLTDDDRLLLFLRRHSILSE